VHGRGIQMDDIGDVDEQHSGTISVDAQVDATLSSIKPDRVCVKAWDRYRRRCLLEALYLSHQVCPPIV